MDAKDVHIHIHLPGAENAVKKFVPRTRWEKIKHVATAPVRIANKVLRSAAGPAILTNQDPAQAGYDKEQHDRINETAGAVFSKTIEQKYGVIPGAVAEQGVKIYTAFIGHSDKPKPIP
jgi:hypothetical protein